MAGGIDPVIIARSSLYRLGSTESWDTDWLKWRHPGQGLVPALVGSLNRIHAPLTNTKSSLTTTPILNYEKMSIATNRILLWFPKLFTKFHTASIIYNSLVAWLLIQIVIMASRNLVNIFFFCKLVMTQKLVGYRAPKSRDAPVDRPETRNGWFKPWS